MGDRSKVTSDTEKFTNLIDQKLILGVIEAIDEDAGTVSVKYLTQAGKFTFNMPAPFFGRTSWIRAYPAQSSYVLIGRTKNDQDPYIIGVVDQSEQTRLMLNDATGVNATGTPGTLAPVDKVATAAAPPGGLPFRKLTAGEIEASSSGKAQWWMAENGDFYTKAGIPRHVMYSGGSFDEVHAAGHYQLGLDTTIDTDADQTYFGVVKRAVDSTSFQVGQQIQASQISTEIDALLANNSNISDAWNKLTAAGNTAASLYTSALTQAVNKINGIKLIKNNLASYNQLSACLPFLTSAINNLYSYRTALSAEELFGQRYGYSQIDFENALVSLMTQQSELQSLVDYITGPIANGSTDFDTANTQVMGVSDQSAIQVPSLNFSAILGKTVTDLKNKQANVQNTLTTLFDALAVPKQEIDSKYVYKSYILEQNYFTKEYRVDVSWKGSPNKLYQKVSGNVYNNVGIKETNPSTGIGLRSRESFFCTDGTATVIFVDSDGNVSHILSPSATNGYTLTVPKGDAKVTLGGDLSLTTGEATIHITKNLTLMVDKMVEINAQIIKLNASSRMQFDSDFMEINANVLNVNTTSTTLQSNASVTIATPSFIHP
jgi:hypothetical protein